MPLWLLLVPYALFLAVFVIFSLIDLWHAWRFRSGFFSAVVLILIYLAGSAGILYLSFLLLAPLEWTRTVSFGVPRTDFLP